LTTLYSFRGGADGAYPYAGVIAGAEGTLYGTTNGGGRFSQGTIFKLTNAGKEYILHSFGKSPDGANPYASLVMDSTGNLYGMTPSGGKYGWGVVFRLNAKNQEKLLHVFWGFKKREGGEMPLGALILDENNNLYGTTYFGGPEDKGILFRLTDGDSEFIVHDFTDFVHHDGSYPGAGVIQDSQGSLYGTTVYGGAEACFTGCGAVYKVDRTGNGTLLYGFLGGSDGEFPWGPLIQDGAGNLKGRHARIVHRCDAAGDDGAPDPGSGTPVFSQRYREARAGEQHRGDQ